MAIKSSKSFKTYGSQFEKLESLKNKKTLKELCTLVNEPYKQKVIFKSLNWR